MDKHQHGETQVFLRDQKDTGCPEETPAVGCPPDLPPATQQVLDFAQKLSEDVVAAALLRSRSTTPSGLTREN